MYRIIKKGEEKMKKGMRFAIAASTLLLFAVGSFAQSIPMVKRARAFARPSPTRILLLLKAKKEELKITDSQLEKIQSLVFSFEEKKVKMRSENSIQRLKLRQLLQDKENLDYEKIEAILSKMSGTRQDMFVEGLKLRDEIQNVLTAEQREALKESIKKRRFFPRDERIRQLPRMRDRIR
jgi:Spy/CpxP family protein refolding chaperone